MEFQDTFTLSDNNSSIIKLVMNCISEETIPIINPLPRPNSSPAFPLKS